MSKYLEKNIVDEVVALFGSDPEFCRVVSDKHGVVISRQSVSQWRAKRCFPAKYALLIEDVTKGKVNSRDVLEASALNAR